MPLVIRVTALGFQLCGLLLNNFLFESNPKDQCPLHIEYVWKFILAVLWFLIFGVVIKGLMKFNELDGSPDKILKNMFSRSDVPILCFILVSRISGYPIPTISFILFHIIAYFLRSIPRWRKNHRQKMERNRIAKQEHEAYMDRAAICNWVVCTDQSLYGLNKTFFEDCDLINCCDRAMRSEILACDRLMVLFHDSGRVIQRESPTLVDIYKVRIVLDKRPLTKNITLPTYITARVVSDEGITYKIVLKDKEHLATLKARIEKNAKVNDPLI